MKHCFRIMSILAILAVVAAAGLQVAPPALAAPPAENAPPPQACTSTPANVDATGQNLWQPAQAALLDRTGAQKAVQPVRFSSYTLDRAGMAALLATAPLEFGDDAVSDPLILALPNPCGGFERFAVADSPIMEPGLAAKHPDVHTYRGRGIDNPAATIRFDLTPLGFHASVRSQHGAWYIDPYFHLDDSVYVTYFGRDLKDDPHGGFAEHDAEEGEIFVDHGYYHAADTVILHGNEFAPNSEITITISDPEEYFGPSIYSATSDEFGSFEASFVADPSGNLDTHIVEATDGEATGWTSYQVVRDDDPTTDPPTGDVLRTYRLALITDPGYAAYFGGPANVTPAKVTLMNRVDQIYEDDLSIRLVLVANNDLLNLDTWAAATGPNGPCGAAACFTQSQVTGCSSTNRARYVVGQIIGASNYDIGHLALGQPGGGVANLGVVGRSNKAGGCTGIPTPVGDYYAVDYVAHEMGHQFSGNHPFNGNQLNCSSGNRNAATSVEPGSGSSVMAYAGICLTDDLQAHSDPYFSQRSLQEISTYTSSDQATINEVQTASLLHFGGGNEIQVVTFGPGYAPAATIQPLSLAINAVPGATSRGGAEESGNTVTIATGNAHTLQVGDTVTISGVGVAGYNGTWTVTAVPGSRSFQYTNPTAGLATSGGGTVTLAVPGAAESGTTVTISTAAAHGRSVGDIVVIAGVGVSGYNGTFTITAVPTSRTFQYTAASSGLASSGSGTATFNSPFQVRIGGNDSAVIGGGGLAYTAANIQTAINAIAGFAGSVTVGSASSTGFTVTYGGASAGLDVPNIEIVNLSCGGCFASVEETNHGGVVDSFKLNYNGNVSAPIVNGVNYTAAGIQTELQGVSEVQTVSLTGYDADGDSYTLNYNGADTVAVTRGQNNTAAGIAAALQGGNEQQAITFANFNAANAGNSYQVMIGGNLSAVLGNGGTTISNANVAAAINAITGFAGTVSVSGASNTAGPTITFAGASSNTDVPPVTIVFGACASAGTPCTATNRENVKGTPAVAGWTPNATVTIGTVADTGYNVTFNGLGDVSQLSVTNGTGGASGTVSTITPGVAGLLPTGATAAIANFGGGGSPSGNGFQVTFGGTLASTNVPVMLVLQDFTTGASGWVGETDKGGAVDNKGGIITPTGDSIPVVTAPLQYTIPLRTPFALTGSATDGDGDTLLYSWEQNDRGGAAGTSLLNNTKVDGALFAMFPKSAVVSDPLVYNAPGENQLTTNPTRVFPDLQQIIDNNTNADTGACTTGPIAPPVSIPVKECFAEFLPTSDYVGFAGTNASPLSLHFRLTARDGNGGVNSADTTVLLATGAGPFLVTSPNTAAPEVTWVGLTTETVTWNVANTNAAPVNCAAVDIGLSTDGGLTYPTALASSTPNDGTEAIVVPNVTTTTARVRVSCSDNIFFDISNASFDITAVPTAVMLASFGAVSQVNQVLVTWETVSELNTAGFNLYRSNSSDGSDRILLASVPAQMPGSTQGASYSYGDTAVQEGRTYYYWLEDIDLNGLPTMHGPVRVDYSSVPTAVRLTSASAGSPLAANQAPAAGAAILALLALSLAGGVVVARRRRA